MTGADWVEVHCVTCGECSWVGRTDDRCETKFKHSPPVDEREAAAGPSAVVSVSVPRSDASSRRGAGGGCFLIVRAAAAGSATHSTCSTSRAPSLQRVGSQRVRGLCLGGGGSGGCRRGEEEGEDVAVAEGLHFGGGLIGGGARLCWVYLIRDVRSWFID